MAINSYNQFYLHNAMDTMGTMLDSAVNTKNLDIDYFFNLFIGRGVAREFENGNPMFITGKSGIELYQVVTFDYYNPPQAQYHMGRSCEYWIGRTVCYYQWHSGRRFGEIASTYPLSKMRQLYPTLHEADVMRSVEYLDAQFRAKDTRLSNIRKQRCITQQQLSMLSGVPVSTIRKYESEPESINFAQINILMALARVLNCNPTDFLSKYDYSSDLPNNAIQDYKDKVIAETNQKLKELETQKLRLAQESEQIERDYNTYRNGYFSQLPYGSFHGTEPSAIHVREEEFLKNWNNYWIPIIQQNSQQNSDWEIKQKNIIEAGKRALHATVAVTRNKTVKNIADAYTIATTDNLSKAIISVLSIIGNNYKK